MSYNQIIFSKILKIFVNHFKNKYNFHLLFFLNQFYLSLLCAIILS